MSNIVVKKLIINVIKTLRINFKLPIQIAVTLAAREKGPAAWVKTWPRGKIDPTYMWGCFRFVSSSSFRKQKCPKNSFQKADPTTVYCNSVTYKYNHSFAARVAKSRTKSKIFVELGRWSRHFLMYCKKIPGARQPICARF